MITEDYDKITEYYHLYDPANDVVWMLYQTAESIKEMFIKKFSTKSYELVDSFRMSSEDYIFLDLDKMAVDLSFVLLHRYQSRFH